MDSMPNRLIFRPKGKAFRGRKQLMKINRSFAEERSRVVLDIHYADDMNSGKEERSSQAQQG